MNIDRFERELDAMIEKEPAFGEWYFSKEKNMILPRDAYEKYQQTLRDITKHLTSEAFRHKMIMRKNGWDEAYLVKEMQRIRDSVDSQKRHCTVGFGDNDYIRHFRGITDYTEARTAILKYKNLSEAIPSDFLFSR
jgi:hypothetical protein